MSMVSENIHRKWRNAESESKAGESNGIIRNM
jgi:hypothetical protein